MTQPINPNRVPTQTFDWGIIKWLVKPEYTLGTGLTFGEVILLPGKGHERHNHIESEEILYVLSGTGEQMIDDDDPFTIQAGDTIYLPIGMYHSTLNTGWEPLRLITVYNPAGAERVLESAPDFKEIPTGELPTLHR